MAAVNETEIVNSSLVKLGADRIISLEGGSRSALIMKEQYHKTRDALLRSHPWNFAIKRVALNALVNSPIGFGKQYQLPQDCLRVLEIIDGDDAEWAVEGDKLLTDLGEVEIRCIRKVTQVGEFDTCFSEALACRLAYDTCYAITQSSSLKDVLLKDYRMWLAEARSFDGQEGGTRRVYADQWLRSRR